MPGCLQRNNQKNSAAALQQGMDHWAEFHRYLMVGHRRRLANRWRLAGNRSGLAAQTDCWCFIDGGWQCSAQCAPELWFGVPLRVFVRRNAPDNHPPTTTRTPPRPLVGRTSIGLVLWPMQRRLDSQANAVSIIMTPAVISHVFECKDTLLGV